MLYEFIIDFIVLNLFYEFVEILFPNKSIKEFVKFTILIIFLFYILNLFSIYINFWGKNEN